MLSPGTTIEYHRIRRRRREWSQGNTTILNSLSNPFQRALLPVAVEAERIGDRPGANLNAMLHSQRTQETYNFNFGLEYELPHSVIVSAGYVGSRACSCRCRVWI